MPHADELANPLANADNVAAVLINPHKSCTHVGRNVQSPAGSSSGLGGFTLISLFNRLNVQPRPESNV